MRALTLNVTGTPLAIEPSVMLTEHVAAAQEEVTPTPPTVTTYPLTADPPEGVGTSSQMTVRP